MHHFVYNHREIEYYSKKNWKELGIEPNVFQSPISNWNTRSEYLEEYVLDYGYDTLSIFELFVGFPNGTNDEESYEENALDGVFNFLKKCDRTVKEHIDSILSKQEESAEGFKLHQEMLLAMEAPISKDHPRAYIALLMEYCNQLFSLAQEGQLFLPIVKDYLLLLCPIAPHHAESEWQALRLGTTILTESFPKPDLEYAKTGKIMIPVQVNGKTKCEVELSRDEEETRAKEIVYEYLLSNHVIDGISLESARFIYVPGKIVNIIGS